MINLKRAILAMLVIISVVLTGCQVAPSAAASPTLSATPTVAQPPGNTPRPSATVKPNEISLGDDERFASPDGTFSFPLPEGWEFISQGDGFFRFSGPGSGSNAPSLVISQMQDQWPFEMWTAMFQDDIAESLNEVDRSSEDFLATEDGQTYFRWEFSAVREGNTYHHIFYMYGSGDWKLVFGYTRPEKSGVENDTAIDTAMQAVIYEH